MSTLLARSCFAVAAVLAVVASGSASRGTQPGTRTRQPGTTPPSTAVVAPDRASAPGVVGSGGSLADPSDPSTAEEPATTETTPGGSGEERPRPADEVLAGVVATSPPAPGGVDPGADPVPVVEEQRAAAGDERRRAVPPAEAAPGAGPAPANQVGALPRTGRNPTILALVSGMSLLLGAAATVTSWCLPVPARRRRYPTPRAWHDGITLAPERRDAIRRRVAQRRSGDSVPSCSAAGDLVRPSRGR